MSELVAPPFVMPQTRITAPISFGGVGPAGPAGESPASDPARGIHVDDYYDVAHGVDDAPSIRAAIVAALTLRVRRIDFSGKTYQLLSTVASDISSTNPLVALHIAHSADWLEQLVIDGHGATLRMEGENFGDMLYIHAAIRQLEVRNLTFERDHLDMPGAGEQCAGLKVYPVAGMTDMHRITVSNCHFIDCHRALEFSHPYPTGGREAFGSLGHLLIEKCSAVYPRGSNMLVTYGGGQAALFSNWIKFLVMRECFFDGATTGDVSGTASSMPVDGFFFCHALNSLVINCHLKHFAVEGMYFTKHTWMSSTDGAFDIPAVGGTCVLPIYLYSPLTGWQVGDRCRLLHYEAFSQPTHEFVVTAINGQSLTVTVLSGEPDSIDEQRPISHEVNWTTPTYAAAINNLFTDIAVIGSQDYEAIEFLGVDHAVARGNRIDRCRVGIGFRDVGVADCSENDIGTTWYGIAFGNPGERAKATILHNRVELLGEGPTVIGIAGPSGSLIGHNQIFMAEAIAGVGWGMRFASNIRDVNVSTNTFTNLDWDVQNESFENLQYYYEGNVLVNVANAQTGMVSTAARLVTETAARAAAIVAVNAALANTLAKTANLSDLSDVAAARLSLGLGALAVLNRATGWWDLNGIGSAHYEEDLFGNPNGRFFNLLGWAHNADYATSSGYANNAGYATSAGGAGYADPGFSVWVDGGGGPEQITDVLVGSLNGRFFDQYGHANNANNANFASVAGSAATARLFIYETDLFVSVTEGLTLDGTHHGRTLICTNAAPITLTLDTGLLSCFHVTIIQKGAGVVTVAGTATLEMFAGFTATTAGQHAQMSVANYGTTDVYHVGGQLGT